MKHSHLLLLACLCACHTSSVGKPGLAPTYSGTLPAFSAASESAAPDKGGAPDDTSLPIGVGFTTGPSALLLGASLDFPVDSMITFGPSLQFGTDDDLSLLAITGQLKYFLPMSEDKGKLLPYLTAGFGFASLDKENKSGDSGALINVGAGLRLLTGDHYRMGSEARLNFLPDELGGEDAYLSFELLQVVVTF